MASWLRTIDRVGAFPEYIDINGQGVKNKWPAAIETVGLDSGKRIQDGKVSEPTPENQGTCNLSES